MLPGLAVDYSKAANSDFLHEIRTAEELMDAANKTTQDLNLEN